ncbi:adult-specific rigid cuticular protein 11.9-like [Limulus polyphemus]|uniref:Adult-specific rigid cuticular protein 11.9-like n=1 Tax=Limulus polyphemus TaxID=6850 RepID=A0ABM1TB30_LIMPO|nr:adult-specific rigid cuticular protein 11.9-like [Limulus polyphemus]
MKFLAVLPLCFAACMAEMLLNFDAEKGNFMYSTGDEGAHAREETRSGGTVTGKYSYIDANGDMREVRYTAGPGGFMPEGDISVDKKTAAEADKIAAMAPKAPEIEPVKATLPVHPFAYSPFYSGHYPFYTGHHYFGHHPFNNAAYFPHRYYAPHARTYSHFY